MPPPAQPPLGIRPGLRSFPLGEEEEEEARTPPCPPLVTTGATASLAVGAAGGGTAAINTTGTSPGIRSTGVSALHGLGAAAVTDGLQQLLEQPQRQQQPSFGRVSYLPTSPRGDVAGSDPLADLLLGRSSSGAVASADTAAASRRLLTKDRFLVLFELPLCTYLALQPIRAAAAADMTVLVALPALLYWLACVGHALALHLSPCFAIARRRLLWGLRLDVALLLLQVSRQQVSCRPYTYYDRCASTFLRLIDGTPSDSQP